MYLINRIYNELFYAGLSKEEFRRVKEPIAEKNRKTLGSVSIIVGLYWLASRFIYGSPEYAFSRTVFISSALFCLIILLCSLFLVKHVPQTLLPLICALLLSFFGTSFALAFLQPDQRIATMICVAMSIPNLFLERPIVTITIEMIAVVFYAVMGKRILNPDVYSWGISTLIIFSSVGVIIGHITTKSRFERYVYIDSAEKLAEIQTKYSEELQKEVEAKTERIVALHDQFVIGMAAMVEGRDNSTGGHIRRTSMGVKILVEEMKKGMQLSDTFCEKIIKAAPMHDLGKIAIDDDILRKPGRFTPEEFGIMKTHTAEGARIVNNILNDTDDEEFRKIAVNIAHYHHERVDGSGYPDGLKGDEIPLEARIMAIADVYDALVSKRVYKESFSFEKANQIITEGMETQFDPCLQPYYEAARPKLEAYYHYTSEQEITNLGA